MKQSLHKAFANMALSEEDDYWDEENEYGNEDYESSKYAQAEAPEAEEAILAEEGSSCQLGDVCAICLSAVEPVNIAIVKGCEHEYCVNCILQWALCKEAPWCPQCKKPFNYLYCHRLLDGTLSDAPVEESVCLLKRAAWFVEHMKTLENGKAVSAAMAAEDNPSEWADPYLYDDEYDGYDDDEQIEKYYFSSAAGRARVVLGNRRLGENGYMRAGRIYARPVNSNGGGGSGSVSGGIGKVGKGRTPGGSKAAAWGGPAVTPVDADSSGAAGTSSGAGSSGNGAGSSSGARASGSGPGPSGCSPMAASAAAATVAQANKGQGRRAKRNARRAAADLQLD